MSIKIIGKKYLDNLYDKVMIENQKGFVTIKCSGDSNNKAKTNELESKLHKFSELEQVEYVVNSYAKSNEINQIQYKKDLKCKTTNEKILHFKSYMSDFTKSFIREIYQIILYKYNYDRENYLKNNNSLSYVISTKEACSSYDMEDEQIKLVLSTDKGLLEGYEEEFIKEFILDKLLKSNGNIDIQNFRWNEFKMSIPCFNVKIDDELFEFDNNEKLRDTIMDVINYYRSNKEERGR